jgi:single-strand DNA-binding protein
MDEGRTVMGSQDMNQVSLIGRLTRDGELRYTASGTALSSFSIAVNRRIKKGDQWTDEASFFDITLWNKQAEGLNKYLLKGGQVAISGYLKQERWQKDGQNFSKVSVHVEDIQLLGGKREGSSPAPQQESPRTSAPQQAADDFDPSVYESDIPF